MPNSKDIYDEVRNRIALNESGEEISQIAHLVINHFFGITRADILREKIIESYDPDLMNAVIDRINREEPVQYILGETDFYGCRFLVNPTVLIPRPETEQLVDVIIRTLGKTYQGRALDIGTGSGCIAVTLARQIEGLEVTAVDISTEALNTAKINARRNSATVAFLRADILSETPDLPLQQVITSNPPYILPSEKKAMQANVLRYEPHEALFVPEDNALVFYEAIAGLARHLLAPEGYIFVEINEAFGKKTVALFDHHGFSNVLLLKDLQGKDRIVVARR